MTLEIAGLGPCSDAPDRTLHLSSQDPVTALQQEGCIRPTAPVPAARFDALLLRFTALTTRDAPYSA